MGMSLLAGLHGQTMVSGAEWLFGALFSATTEAQSQVQATEEVTFSGMRGEIASDGNGTNNFRFRNNSANGNQFQAVVGPGPVAFEDAVNSDTVAAGNPFNGAYTDSGTSSIMRTVGFNVEFTNGHGNFHMASGTANVVMDVDGSTRYLPIHGLLAADGTATIANVQFEVREYTTIEAYQIRINANVRTSDSVYSLNINGTDVGTPITFATTATGLQVVTEQHDLVPGDLVCISQTLGAGAAEDLNFGFCCVTMKSTGNASAAGYGSQNGTARAASATANYYSFGGGTTTVQTSAAFKVGFAARCASLRCYLSANTYTADATLKLFVNGSDSGYTTTITAGGGAGWYRNLADHFDISETDTVSFEIVGGTSGSITIHQIFVSFEPIPEGATRWLWAA